jgi:hypothetical protein
MFLHGRQPLERGAAFCASCSSIDGIPTQSSGVDMSKAYDRIEWPFVYHVLALMGYLVRVVELIMRCVT